MIRVRDKDAPWISPEIKNILHEKSKAYRRYVKNGRAETDLQILKLLQASSKLEITKAASEYQQKLAKSLNDSGIGPKKYWSIIHRLLNKRKIPQIPPIHHNNVVITDTSQRADIFNSFFTKQCSLLNTSSVLPQPKVITEHRLTRKF